MRKMNRISYILKKLWDGHVMYGRGDVEYKKRLERAFEPFFVELENLGVDRIFAEGCLFWGKEFVDSVRENNEWWKVKKKAIELGYVEYAELIFGVMAKKLTKKEERELELAEKNGALIFKSLPMVGEKVGINISVWK